MHSKSKEDIMSELQVNIKEGLSDQVVTSRLSKYGSARLKEKKKVSNITKFLAQFKDVMIIILLFAAAKDNAIDREEIFKKYERMVERYPS